MVEWIVSDTSVDYAEATAFMEARAEAIAAVFRARGHDVVKLGDGRDFLHRILTDPVDIVFNTAEGEGIGRSREARVPAVLEMLGIPHTGSDPLTLAVTLDKDCARRLVATAGVAVPPGFVVQPDDDPERSAEKIRAMLGRLPERLERVAVAVRRPRGDERSAWFTFRPGGDRRPAEDTTLRGLHPMVAERLGLWRLRDFALTRLPSPIDVHLFRAVGRNVPDDRRLIALSDVRDLTLLRDESGKIRALAVTSARRTEFLPEVPTIAESGYPGFEATNWYAYVLPAKTPSEIVDRWNRELVKILNDPGVRKALLAQGMEPAPSTRAELAAYIKREYDTWARVVKAANITAN